ncbi:ABC transporter ATP-binding protein [Cohnella soli]|uniref:ATP-binding cassette domain-containing protein n=1 Tax=Cohnella soli TaxID=425005 RepID=A0ABW0I209_9BACL
MKLLTAQRIGRRYGQTIALGEASFSIGDRRCIALLGPNGAGKTTTLSILAGLLEPTSGEMLAEGGLPADRRRWMGFLPQQPAFFGWMTGRETMETAGRLCGLSAKEASNRTKILLEQAGLTDAADRRVGGYSGGMKQRLGLAQAVIHRPRLLLLDEPVSALDPIGRREVLTMLEQWKRDMSIVLSTHVLHDAEQVCDDIILMNKGSVVLQGEMDHIRQSAGRPYIRIETEAGDNASEWLATLEKLPGVRMSATSRYSRSIETDDIDGVRETALRTALEGGIKLLAFEVARKSLEQWFVEALNE